MDLGSEPRPNRSFVRGEGSRPRGLGKVLRF
jgi:hypothetical protein